MEVVLTVIATALGAGLIGAFLLFRNSKKELAELKSKMDSKEFKALTEEEAIERSSLKAKEMLLKARTEMLEMRSVADEKLKNEQKEIDEREKRLDLREWALTRDLSTE